VSDLDSDLEPDQLIPTYIKIKGKLFEIDPDAVDAKPRKQPKGTKGRQATQANAVQSPAVRKLLSQIQQLASDALFDVVEAEAQWPVKRNEIAQMKAAQRLEQSTAPSAPEHQNGTVSELVSKKEAEPRTMEADDASVEDDDAALFGGMFSAVPDDPSPPDAANGATSDNITLRDFGKQSGVSPRRVLEETVRARFVISLYP
jgi:ATP-dependent RNA helicase DHX29